ncbi:acyl-CoA dehydrogenase family protein [Actinoplanes sp. G11-F43]|uniref:acyl-CoA dehydrogenase family protein n=1 Tax=Actinoplanes sp. G11-F43 TaxID=3424130 RepID=UPI003D353E6B
MAVPQNHDAAIAAAHQLADLLEPGAIQRDRDGAEVIPHEAVAALDASGLLGITVPAADGGPGLGPRTLAEVARILAMADPAIAQIPQGHYLMVDAIVVHGGAEARKRILGDVLAGRRLGNGLAERGGKHAQDLTTRITGGLLNGVKYYTTGALTSAWIAASALDETGRVVLALVPRDASGVAIDTDWDMIGQRATISGTATFTGVPVEPGLRIDWSGAFETPQQLGARAQLVHTAIEVGIAGAALRDARGFLREKGRPSTEAVRKGASAATDDPHVRHRYGRLATRVRAAEALLESAAGTLAEVGLIPSGAEAAARGSLAVAAAKAFGTEVALEASSELFTLCGTSSAAAKYALDRHWRNARTHSVHDPIDYKYAHIAAFELADEQPPNHGQI